MQHSRPRIILDRIEVSGRARKNQAYRPHESEFRIGDTLSITYLANNQEAYPVTVWLGAAINGDHGERYTEGIQEHTVDLPPGVSTQQRSLTIPLGWSSSYILLIATLWLGRREENLQDIASEYQRRIILSTDS